MPVYNGERYLRESVESILNQTFKDFEFVIVDDGSTDNSVEIIRSYCDRSIRLVENIKNLGQSKSLNIGLKKARGEYIARLDQDDIALKFRLEEQVRFLDLHPNVAIVGSFRKYINSKGNIIAYSKDATSTPALYFKPFVIGSPSLQHPFVMFRKKNVVSINAYNENYAYSQDLCLICRMLEVGDEFANIPKVLTLYRKTESRGSQTLKERTMVKEGAIIHAKFLTKQLGRTIKPDQLIWHQPSRLRDYYNERNNSYILEKLEIITEITELYFSKYQQPLFEKLKLISSLWVNLLMTSLSPKRNIGRVLENNTKICLRIIETNISGSRFQLILFSMVFYVFNITLTLPMLVNKFSQKFRSL